MTHICNGPETWTARMRLAVHTRSPDSYQIVRDEIGNCARCWEAVAHWAINSLAGVYEISAKTIDEAIDSATAELARTYFSE